MSREESYRCNKPEAVNDEDDVCGSCSKLEFYLKDNE